MPMRVILLNGASSSGKSTLAKSLQKYIKDSRKEEYIITSQMIYQFRFVEQNKNRNFVCYEIFSRI